MPAAWRNGAENVSYILYLPVRNTLVDNSGFIGVPPGSYIAGTPPNAPAAPGDTAPVLKGGDDQIVWYGTSIQQGGVASRAGNLYDAIIGRRLSREVLNFGFAGASCWCYSVHSFRLRGQSDSRDRLLAVADRKWP